MSNKERDIYDSLKYAGFYLTQAIYKAEKIGVDKLDDLIKKYTARMFNYIHNKRQVEFLVYLEKIYASISLQPQKDIIEMLRVQQTRKFQKYALAFMMGFMSEPKKDNERGG